MLRLAPLLLLLLIGAQRVRVEGLATCSGGQRVLRGPLQHRPQLRGGVAARQTGRGVRVALLPHGRSDLHLRHGIPDVVDGSHHHVQHGPPLGGGPVRQPRLLPLARAAHLPLDEEEEGDEDQGHQGQLERVQPPSEEPAEG